MKKERFRAPDKMKTDQDKMEDFKSGNNAGKRQRWDFP